MISLQMAASLTAFVIGAMGVLGLLVGSFLNVVAFRVPAGRSIVSPPSACPSCSTAIRPYDNIPVISWLVLRGRCRDCRTPISFRYPLVEAATGVFFAVVAWWSWGRIATEFAASTAAAIASVLELIALLSFAAVSVVLTLIDLDTHRLPDAVVFPSFGAGAVLLGTTAFLRGDLGAAVGMVVGAIALFVFYFIVAWIRPGGMGMGDVKLAALVGLFLGYLGWSQLVVGAFAAFLFGGIFVVGLLATRRVTRHGGIPFGPWMLAGAWFGVFLGPWVAQTYLSLTGLS
ncbi:prepilin peptidase [Leifsonia sp. NPDC102414]|uniref:prepilin peptidase n=1 Tax=Leifsonia sp. NPDC102414 TaxID=3364124 RepID=UPI00380D3305